MPCYLKSLTGGFTMRLDKFTIKAQEALQDAQQMAVKSGHLDVGTPHLLAALLAQEGGLISPLLQKIGVDPSQIKIRAIEALEKLPTQSGDVGQHFSAALQKVTATVEDEAKG